MLIYKKIWKFIKLKNLQNVIGSSSQLWNLDGDKAGKDLKVCRT